MAIQGEGEVFALERCETDEAWRQARTKGIGGSDVAAIMGLSPWKTPLEVWLEKTGRETPADISQKPYVKFGNDFEPFVGSHYKAERPTETVRRVNAMCRNIKRPWATASLDYEVKRGDAWGVLEIKTARCAKDWDDGVPLYYMTQVLHYLSVTGRPFASVCVFFRDTCEYRIYDIEPDADDMAAVVGAVDAFWLDFVSADVMPQVTGDDGAHLANLFDQGDDYRFETDSRADALAEAYERASADEKAAKAKKNLAAAELEALIGDSKGIETELHRVTWTRGETSRLDTKALKEEQPDIYQKYCKTAMRNGGIRVKEIG